MKFKKDQKTQGRNSSPHYESQPNSGAAAPLPSHVAQDALLTNGIPRLPTNKPFQPPQCQNTNNNPNFSLHLSNHQSQEGYPLINLYLEKALLRG